MSKTTALAVATVLAGCLGLSVLGAAPAFAQPGPPPVPPEFAALPTTFDPGTYATAAEHYEARLQAANGGTQHTAETLPDWSGVWENAPNSGFSIRPGERFLGRGMATETTMKLTPRYAAEHEMRMRWGEQGRDFDPLSFCLPAGFPRWLSEPFLKEFLATPERTLLMNEMMSEVRRVYTDGRGHVPADYAYPLWLGDSIGFWDGPTLVIHTNTLKANLYQREQPAHSDKVETVEEWTEIRDGVMEVKVSIYDPEALLEPHHSIRYYRQIDDQDGAIRVGYWSCEENQPVIRSADGGTNFGVLPTDEGAPDLTDAETWLAFDEAEEAGLIEGGGDSSGDE